MKSELLEMAQDLEESSPDYRVKDIIKLLRDAAALLEKRAAALRPFAGYADPGSLPDQFIISQGSSMARRQLTMKDCRLAKEALGED